MTLEEFARRFGEDPDRIRTWQALGFVGSEPLGTRDVERARLVRALLRRGIALETIVASDHETGFLARYAGATRSSDAVYSLEEAAVRVGIEVAVLTRLADAARLLERRELLSDDDLRAFTAMKVALDAGFPEAALRQLARVYVDAIGRVADAENRLFHFYVHDPLKAEGLQDRDLFLAVEAMRDRLMPLLEPMILYFHREAWFRAQTEDAALHFREDAVGHVAEGPPGQLDVVIAFVDLAGFTSLTEAMGDEAAADVLERFSQVVRDAAGRADGRVVKQIGDAFMLVFSDARAALACALEIEERSQDEPAFAAVRTGIHGGRVLYREGDYVGTAVNLAARLAALAERHQILVTAAVATAAADLTAADFAPIGRRRVRGIGEEIEVFAVTRGDARASTQRPVIDPVCGMEVDARAVAARLWFAGTEYFFCSQQCLQRFATAPERY